LLFSWPSTFDAACEGRCVGVEPNVYDLSLISHYLLPWTIIQPDFDVPLTFGSSHSSGRHSGLEFMEPLLSFPSLVLFPWTRMMVDFGKWCGWFVLGYFYQIRHHRED
jgi:hypothetical protein